MTTNEIDHLTQLPSRSAFDQDIQNLFAEASGVQPCALAMADIDHFKKVNDSFGHQTGDDVLREVANCLCVSIEGKGNVYRYGGEEFAMFLPNHNPDEAIAVMERSRKAIEALKTSVGRITMSFGIAIVPDLASTPDEWLKKADDALYNAKHLGRNLVRLWGEPDPEPEETRKPVRKEPVPGTISDEEKEELRIQYLRQGLVLCPKDQIPMDVIDMTAMGESGRSFIVTCPGCGFSTHLPSPGS